MEKVDTDIAKEIVMFAMFHEISGKKGKKGNRSDDVVASQDGNEETNDNGAQDHGSEEEYDFNNMDDNEEAEDVNDINMMDQNDEVGDAGEKPHKRRKVEEPLTYEV